MVEWDADYVPGVKLGLHCAQILLGFVIFILEIVLFRSDNATINGNNGWPFGLCFLSLPACVYLMMAPRWKRTQKIAQPHAMLMIDCIFAILWLSAFASQAAYNTANSCGDGCKVSKAIVGIAFFEILFWAASTFLSAYTLKYYRFHGNLPGYDNIARKGGHQNIDPDKAAFSMAPHDEEAYAPVNADDHDDHSSTPYNADSYTSRPMFDSETDYRPHSTTPSHDNPFGDHGYRPHSTTPSHDNPFGDSGYRAHSVSPANDPYSSGYGSQPEAGGPRIYAPPSAQEYDDGRPAQFPTANYDRTLH
ncbi:chaperone-binding protein [Seiridium cupressi]